MSFTGVVAVCQAFPDAFPVASPSRKMVKDFETRLATDQDGTEALFKTALSGVWPVEDCYAPVSHPAPLPALYVALQA